MFAKFKDNIWAENLAEMQSLSSFHRGVKYLLWVIDVFIKYGWVNPLKDKKSKTVFHGFIEIVNESCRKPNKLWVAWGKEVYNNFMQNWLDDHDILMYSTHNEGKSVDAERFTRTLTSKIYQKMTANNKKCYLGFLNNLVDIYNNTYHFSIGNACWCWLFCFDWRNWDES